MAQLLASESGDALQPPKALIAATEEGKACSALPGSALRPLLTIADETQKLCDQLWSDPLMATEFSYAARTTPEHQL